MSDNSNQFFFTKYIFKIYDFLQKYGLIDLGKYYCQVFIKLLKAVSLRLLLDVDILLDLHNCLEVVVEVDHLLVDV